jgi:ACS family 4-hydroxyphenylacetate permease-like MFS transporter
MPAAVEDLEQRAVRKVSRRLLWFLVILYGFSYLDRINIGFVAFCMSHDLKLTSTQFGAASTILYLGYILCEIPSNLMLARFGARVWLSRIMITWGIASAATMFATGAHSLYSMRFLVGITEGGFLPGVLLYLTLWFPQTHRARANALFMVAQPVTMATGAFLSEIILSNWHSNLVEAWRVMFLVEGVPSTILGIIAYFYLTDKPRDAKWLTAEEKEALARDLAPPRTDQPTPWREVLSRSVVLLSLSYFCLVMTLNTIVTWIPTIVRTVKSNHVGTLTAFPAVFAAVCMPFWSAHSDRTRERAWHIVTPMVLAALGWMLVALFTLPGVRMLGLMFCVAGGFSAMSVFWTVPQALLSPAARPAGIAFVSSCGILASIVTPLLIGFLRDATQNFVAGLLFLAFALIGASGLVLLSACESPPFSKEPKKRIG